MMAKERGVQRTICRGYPYTELAFSLQEMNAVDAPLMAVQAAEERSNVFKKNICLIWNLNILCATATN